MIMIQLVCQVAALLVLTELSQTETLCWKTSPLPLMQLKGWSFLTVCLWRVV